MAHPMVGQVHFEDRDGNRLATMTYTQHPMLRAPQLAFNGIWYEQNHQTAEGEWVYRAMPGLRGSIGTDSHLKEGDG